MKILKLMVSCLALAIAVPMGGHRAEASPLVLNYEEETNDQANDQTNVQVDDQAEDQTDDQKDDRTDTQTSSVSQTSASKTEKACDHVWEYDADVSDGTIYYERVCSNCGLAEVLNECPDELADYTYVVEEDGSLSRHTKSEYLKNEICKSDDADEYSENDADEYSEDNTEESEDHTITAESQSEEPEVTDDDLQSEEPSK